MFNEKHTTRNWIYIIGTKYKDYLVRYYFYQKFLSHYERFKEPLAAWEPQVEDPCFNGIVDQEFSTFQACQEKKNTFKNDYFPCLFSLRVEK